jgi:hypothetical protein
MEEDYDFRDGDCFYLSDFEEESNHVLELDDRIYASDFEEDLEYIVGVEEFLQGTHGFYFYFGRGLLPTF